MSEFVMRSCTAHDESGISREPRDNWQQQSLKSFFAPSVGAVSAVVPATMSCETAYLPVNMPGPSVLSNSAHTGSVPGVVNDEMTDPIL